MNVEQVASRTDQVTTIIQRAAQNNQQDFNFMLAQARIESGLNPAAKAKTSSAAGLYQFTSGTWMDLVKRHGDKVGLDESARLLRSGNITSIEKSDLLAKRHDPALSSELAARFAIENAQTLQRSGHEKVGAAELYIAHFLGPHGANTFLNGLKTQPDAPAAQALPQAANANTQIFYSGGKPRSYADIFGQLQKKFNVETPSQVAPANPAPVSIRPAAIVKAMQANGEQRIAAAEQKSFLSGGKPPAPGERPPVPGARAPAPEKTGENMTTPPLDKTADMPLSEASIQGVAVKALRQTMQESSGETNISLDEASLGSFLRGFSLQQADPGLTPIINDAETRDASTGTNSDQSGNLDFGASHQLSGHAIGGRLIIKTIERSEGGDEAKVEDARRPAPTMSSKAAFSEWAALWGGASKGGAPQSSK